MWCKNDPAKFKIPNYSDEKLCSIVSDESKSIGFYNMLLLLQKRCNF